MKRKGGQKVGTAIVHLKIPESQIVELMQQISPAAKRDVLRALILQLDELEDLVDYGDQRIRALCAEGGLDWHGMSEEERERLVDELLHGKSTSTGGRGGCDFTRSM